MEGKPLRSLKEADNEARMHYGTDFGPHRNGIACPKCGGELMDSNSGQVIQI